MTKYSACIMIFGGVLTLVAMLLSHEVVRMPILSLWLRSALSINGKSRSGSLKTTEQ